MKTLIDYLNTLDPKRKLEMEKLHKFIQETLPNLQIKLWNFSGQTIGYGTYHYKTKSGCEGDMPIIGLSSRKQYISLYACGYDDKGYLLDTYQNKLQGAIVKKGCIQIKKLELVDLTILKEIIQKTAQSLALTKG